MTAKSHHAVMHVVHQLKCQGPGAFFSEFWIERMIWYLKLYLKDRVKDNGEIIFVDDHLLVKSALTCRCEFPDLCLTIEERHKASAAPMLPPDFDEVCDGVLLLGKRVRIKTSDLEEVTAAVVDVLANKLPLLLREPAADGVGDGWFAERGWPAVSEAVLHAMFEKELLHIDKFLQASLTCTDVVSSVEDVRKYVTENEWVTLSYEKNGEQVRCVGQVQYFVRLSAHTGAAEVFDPRGCGDVDDGSEIDGRLFDAPGRVRRAVPLRLAVCKLWAAEVLDTAAMGSPAALGGGVPDLLYVSNLGELPSDCIRGDAAPDFSTQKRYYGLYPVVVAEMEAKVVPTGELTRVVRVRGGGEEHGGRQRTYQYRYFMSCSKVSGR